MKIVSWNINGLNSCLNKGFLEFFKKCGADFFCIQETKIQREHKPINLEGYQQYWAYCERKGYSGVAIFTKHPAISVKYGMGMEEFDREGRLITLEYDEFYLLNVYTPNSKSGLSRLDFRMAWDDAFKEFVGRLSAVKFVIVCGDMNAVEIDSKARSLAKRTSLGFCDEDCEKFSNLLNDIYLVDAFKYLYPEDKEAYTWRSYTKQKKGENSGWRIDYFLISQYLLKYLKDAHIFTDVGASDHYPIALDLDLSII